VLKSAERGRIRFARGPCWSLLESPTGVSSHKSPNSVVVVFHLQQATCDPIVEGPLADQIDKGPSDSLAAIGNIGAPPTPKATLPNGTLFLRGLCLLVAKSLIPV